MSFLTRASLLVGLALLGGCRSEWYPARFVPAPLEVSLDSPRVPDAKGRALLTVVGIRRADYEAKRGDEVVVRMRIENAGARKLTVLPDSFKLVSDSLADFGVPVIVELPTEPLAEGQSMVFEIRFGVPVVAPPDELVILGLNLKWDVDFEGERIGTGVTFERYFEPYPNVWYYDPYYSPFYDPWCVHSHVSVGFGHED